MLWGSTSLLKTQELVNTCLQPLSILWEHILITTVYPTCSQAVYKLSIVVQMKDRTFCPPDDARHSSGMQPEQRRLLGRNN